MKQQIDEITVSTRGRTHIEVTRHLANWLQNNNLNSGLLTIFIRHTSASLTIQENADSDVMSDLNDALDGLAPRHAPYRHSLEGPDDMPAHIKSSLTGVDLTIPVQNGHMMLGTWQGVYILEHRDHSHSRKLALHFIGE